VPLLGVYTHLDVASMPTVYLPNEINNQLEQIHSQRFPDDGNSVPPYLTLYDAIKLLDESADSR